MASLMKGGSRSDKSKIVLVDMDGVIVDYELGYERAVSALFPGMDLIPREERKVFYSDVQYSELYPEHREEFQRIAVTPRFFRDMPIMKGAKEALEKLNGRYTLFICSAPMTLFHDCVREKYEWVEEHLGFEFTKQIILTRDKTVVSALEKLNGRYTLFICSAPMTLFHDCVREKYEWVEEHLGFEFTKQIILTRDKTVVSGAVLIDDKPKIKGCMAPSWKHIVFDQPYNEESETEFRVKNWDEVDKLCEYIDSL